MSISCQFTVMAPPSSATVTQQPNRLARRRNAMANVMDGMSAADIDHIRVQAPAPTSVNTASGTCISSPATSPSHTSTSSSSDDNPITDSSDSMTLAALAFSPLSPKLRRRRNALADALADIDQGSLMKIRAAHQSSQHDSHHDHDSTGMFPIF